MSRRIKILLTIPNFNTAGSGKVLYDLANALDKTKFDVSIACGDNLGVFFKSVEALGLPIYIYETKTPYRPYYSLLFRVLKISKFYRKHQFDMIHSWQWSSDWTEALAAKLAGVKWIYTKKAMGLNNRNWRIKSYLADFIITINSEMRQYFPNKKRQALIPLGIDTDFYNPNLFEIRKSKSNSSFNIITVVNMVPVKGIHILIEAIAALKDKSVTLTVLGDFNNNYGQQMIELSERLGLTNQLCFEGKKLDVRPYLMNADLYVIPTLDEGRKEGMPMALIEAMSMAVPVLGSDITGINFVLKDYKQFLFKPGDVASLVNGIQMMKSMSQESRAKLGQELRDYTKKKFPLSVFIENHEHLYCKLLNRD